MITGWKECSKELPTEQDIKKSRRVLIYSPLYEKEFERYRLLDAQFVRISTDATHWAYCSPPKIPKKP
jgi:hypothetical protein